MKIILNLVRTIITISAFVALGVAVDLSGDTARDFIRTEEGENVYNTHTIPNGSFGASAGFAIMSGLCFVGLGLTFIRQDS